MRYEKNFVLTKYPREKISDLRNTHEKKLWTHEILTRHEIPPRIYFEPTKYPRENILGPRNTRENILEPDIPTKARWH